MKKTTQEQLKYIAERLWSEQASLFVGAGFSKNAQLQAGAKVPPNWDELGDLFFEKTRNRRPNQKDRAYANVLRLAEEVDNLYGRAVLADLIKNAINDDLLTPSDVHLQLMALPWQDVFTTNYDTLLERSAEVLKQKTYTTILTDPAIGMGSHPFLIKVHGDIRDPQSIIITEEDYRRYPKGHSGMITCIHDTIMTKTLVMIGFSGNDPNFIQWQGWVRDALCNNQRQVFLLSVDAISEATRRTFERKNIIIVDLRGFARKGATPSENVAAAIKYLGDYHFNRKKDDSEYRSKALKWGRTPTSGRDESFDKTFDRWKQERTTYPGWLIMPREKREYWASVEGFYLSQEQLSQLKDGNDLLFLDLFNWRIEKCLFPIENVWEETYLAVLNKYKPFTRRCRSDFREAWLNLKLGLLRLYRQEGWRDKWNNLHEELNHLKSKMGDDQRCRFEYERALESVYRNDFKTLEVVLEDWTDAQNDVYWDIRKGALWAEYLSFSKGKEITKQAFDRICSKLETSDSDEERFFWASRKVHAHTVWDCMTQANFTDGHEETSSARRTWQELRAYDDIWYEREFFDSHLRPIEAVLKVKTKTAAFKLGYSSTTTNISGNSKDYRIAYAFFMFYEDAGFPIHLPFLNTVEKTSLEKALSVMSYCSPCIAETWLLRSGDPKMVQAVYNRRFLNRTSNEIIETLYQRYLVCFNNVLQAEENEQMPSWILAFRNVLPEILSRLCMKASLEARTKTLDYVDVVFREKDSIRYDGIDRLLSSLLTSFSDVEIICLIPKMTKMAIARDRFGDCRFEPLYYVHSPSKVGESLSDTIDLLLDSLGKDKNDDKAILYRLVFLYKCNALTKRQQIALSEKLWARRDNYGFPSGTIFNKFAFLAFPHPQNVDPQALMKTYFRGHTLPVSGTQKTITFYGGYTPILNDIKGTSNNGIQFSWDEDTLNHVCAEIIRMWDSDKQRLLENEEYGFGFSAKGDIQERFDDVETIVSTIMAPNLVMLNENNIVNLMHMAYEFEEFGMPSLRMRLALSSICGDVPDMKTEIRCRLNSTNYRYVDDSIKAIKLLDKRGEDVMWGVEHLSEFFRCNTISGWSTIIRGINYFVSENQYVKNGVIRTNLLLGLERLWGVTAIEDTDEELTANNKMHLRMNVAPIVKALLKYGQDESSNTLLTWKEYYESKETCWDIRNAFC